MYCKISLIVTVAAGLLLTAPFSAQAGDTGAFVGGMLTSRVMHNMRARTEAEQQQAYYARQSAQQQQVRQAAPAPSSTQTTQQKLAELDKLAAGGYITPEEYKAKRQSIIDAM
jgi:hypothetical protein